jgi:hypothetical protein
MKHITKLSVFLWTLALTVFSMNAIACKNYLPLSEAVKAVNLEAGAGKIQCKDLPSEQCLCFDGIVWQAAEIVDVMIDDTANPIMSKSEAEPCSGQADCQLKLGVKECSDSEETAYIDEGFTEVYCSKITGYPQIASGSKKLQNNPTKMATYEAQVAAEKAQSDAIAQAKQAMACGEDVIALLLVLNVPKGLTTAQIKQVNQTYADIKDLLETGSLVSAREEIQAVTPDGTLVTEADKIALTAKIDECLGQ